MWKQADNMTGMFNTQKGPLRFLPFGVVISVLILSGTSLLAGGPSASPSSETKAIDQISDGSTAPTNASAASADDSMESLDDKYKLGIGDRLSFKIVEDEEDPKQLDITDSGDVEIPYIGRVPAAGKTCKQLSAELKTKLEKKYYYQATVVIAVDLKARSQGKVYLVGPVRSPGPQDIPSDEEFTLSKAILRAGGFGDFADEHHVRVTRKEPGQDGAENKTYIVDVGKVLEKGRTDLDLVLEAGDLIYIPEKTIRF